MATSVFRWGHNLRKNLVCLGIPENSLDARATFGCANYIRTASTITSNGLNPSSTPVGSIITIDNHHYPRDAYTNATEAILSKVGRRLLHTSNHPLCIIKNYIQAYFQQRHATLDDPAFKVCPVAILLSPLYPPPTTTYIPLFKLSSLTSASG